MSLPIRSDIAPSQGTNIVWEHVWDVSDVHHLRKHGGQELSVQVSWLLLQRPDPSCASARCSGDADAKMPSDLECPVTVKKSCPCAVHHKNIALAGTCMMHSDSTVFSKASSANF